MAELGEMTIGSRTARAAIWSLLATTSTRIISLVSLVLLARLLAPRDFGLLTFALVYITYVETIGDLGTGLALIYWPERKDDAAQVSFWINLATGLGWFLLTLLLAPAIAAFFNAPEATGIVQALAWSFPLKYLGNTHDALAQKELRFRARLVPELGFAAGKALLAIAFAFAGFGAWSLVFGHLGGLTCWTALQWLVIPWRPRLRFPTELLRPMLRYGRGMIAVNVLAAIVHHADFAIVGRMLGASVLGVYQMAARVPEMSITVLIWVAGKVLFPAFAAVHAAGEDLKAAYLSALRYLSLLTVPAAVGLALTAEPVVLTFLGEKWRPAIPMLRALAVYAGLRALGAPAGDLLKAIGRSHLLARLAVVKAALLLPALIAAATQDATTVAIALVAVTGVTLILNLGIAAVSLRVSAAEIARAFRVSLIGGFTLSAMILVMARWLNLPPALELLVMIGAGASTYAATVALLDPDALRTARQKIWSRDSGDFVKVGRSFLPRGDTSIQRYFLENLYVTHRARERWVHAVAPRILLGARDGAAGLEEILSADGMNLLREITSGIAWRPIAVIDYEESRRSRIVLFLFKPNATEPSAVAKLRPLRATGSLLEQEWDALKYLEALPREIRDTIPTPLGYQRSGDFEALLLSHLPGRSAYVEMHGLRPRRHVRRHFDAAADWLARLHLATRVGSHCAVHGDFWARNLLTAGGSRATGVVDWEHFARSGSPFQDLFHFPLTYGLRFWRDREPIDAFRMTFIKPTPVSAAVRQYLDRYGKASGLDFSALREGVETYLLARGGEEKLPWRECQQILSRASRSVFSG